MAEMAVYMQKLLCILSLGLTVALVSDAQAPEDVNNSTEISDLHKELSKIEQQQIHIVELLNDLNKSVASRVVTSPAESPSRLLVVRGESLRGDPGAGIAIVEYADFECPYCGIYERETYPRLFESYIKTGKVKYIYKDLPLAMHSHALQAAQAARCAGEQGKYWEMHDNLFANQAALSDIAIASRAQSLGIDTVKLRECLSSERYKDAIMNSSADAGKMGIDGTPTFFLGTIEPNGDTVKIEKTIRGSYPYEVFKSALDELLAAKPGPVSAH